VTWRADRIDVLSSDLRAPTRRSLAFRSLQPASGITARGLWAQTNPELLGGQRFPNARLRFNTSDVRPLDGWRATPRRYNRRSCRLEC
jgi:hypothetical protein